MRCKKKERLTFFLIVLILIIAVSYFSSHQDGMTGMVVGSVEEAEVEEEVLAGLSEKGEVLGGETSGTTKVVSVIVVLKEDTETASDNLEEKKEAIKEKQEGVLKSLNLEEKKGVLGILSEEKDFEIGHKYSTINAFSGEVTEEGLEKLKKDPKVKKVFFNKVLHITLDASVPQINADDTWDLSVNGVDIAGAGETVCVVDTGIDTDHSAFTGRIVDQYCYCSGGCCPDGNTTDDSAEDDHGHGTHVAGIAAGNHSTYRGVAPEAGIIAIKVCDSAGSCNSDDVISAIDWCTNNASKYNISVISMSLGGEGPYNTYCDDNSYGIAPGINSAIAENIGVVIAAGNNGWTDGISSPACVENATPAGAVDSSDGIIYNRGSILDLLAPGIGINAPYKGGGTAELSGTSMAAPHAAGAFVLFRQYWRLAYGIIPTPKQIEYKFDLTGKPVDDSGNTYSRIDVLKAIQPYINFTKDSVADGIIQEETSAFVNVASDVDLTDALLEWDYNNGTATNITMNQNNETNFYYNNTGLALGNHTYKIYGNDSANTFGISETRVLEVSPVPPNIIIYYPENDGCHKEGFNLNITVTDVVLSSSSYYIANSSGEVIQENSNLSIEGSSFNWLDFVNASNPSFVDGSYSLSVFANDSLGDSAVEEINFIIDKTGPALFGFDKSPAVVYNNNAVVFYVNVTDGNRDNSGVLIEGNWTGSFVNYTMELGAGDGFNYSVSSGNFSNQERIGYRFYAFDLLGNMDNSSLFDFTVQNRAPINANISEPAEGTAVEVGDLMQFNGTATDPDSDSLSYAWDFNDSTSSSEQNPLKQFNLTGTFGVVLNVSDGYGFSLANATIVVNDTQPAEITSISYDNSVHIENEVNQTVSAVVSDYSGIFDATLYFGDSVEEGSCTESSTSRDCTWSWGNFSVFDDYEFIIEVIDNFSMKHAQNHTYDFSVIGCGDERLNGDEECDTDNLDGETCSSQGYDSGTLVCSSSCVFDIGNCSDNSDDDSSDSGGDSSSGSGGGSGGGSSITPVCSIGVIQCVGLTQYKECLESGWSDVLKVPKGKECKAGKLSVMEVRVNAKEIVETTQEAIEEDSQVSFASSDATNLAVMEDGEGEGEVKMQLVGMAVGFLENMKGWNSKTKVVLALGMLILFMLVFYFVVREKE